MNKNPDTENKTGDFESKIAELQRIVDALESDGGVTLEDSMKLYETGLRLTEDCVAELNGMQAQINELNGKLDLILSESPFGDDNE